MATPRPLVVWIRGTDPSPSARLATPAAALVSATGFAVASIDYRTGPGVTTTMQVADAKAAFDGCGRTPANTGSILRRSPSWVSTSAAESRRCSARLQTWRSSMRSSPAQPGRLACRRSSLLAAPLTSSDPNPITFVTKDDAPTLIFHGTADDKVPTRQSQLLVSALKVAGVTTTLDMPVGVGHDVGALLSPIAMQTVNAFLQQHLLGARATTGSIELRRDTVAHLHRSDRAGSGRHEVSAVSHAGTRRRYLRELSRVSAAGLRDKHAPALSGDLLSARAQRRFQTSDHGRLHRAR